MRFDTNADPAFRPITITLESLDEARALKRLCTNTAKDAVLARPRLNVDSDVVHDVADGIYRHLADEGVSYLATR